MSNNITKSMPIAQKKTTNDTLSRNFVQAENFDVSKYSLDPIFEEKSTGAKSDNKGSAQSIAFPKYDYGAEGKVNNGKSTRDKFIVVTKPIKMAFGGIPKVDEQWRPTNNHCNYFWLPYVLDDEGSTELFEKVLAPLDAHHIQKIDTEGNKDFFYKEVEGKKKAPKDLEYLPGVRTSKGSDDDDSNDDKADGENDKKSVSKQYKRLKVRMDTVFDKTRKADDKSDLKIKTRLFLNNEDGTAKEDYESIDSLDGFREHFGWNCVAQFALEFNKFWAKKAGDAKGRKECGYTVKCTQILIIERSQGGSPLQELGRSVFGAKKSQSKALTNNSEEMATTKNMKSSDNKETKETKNNKKDEKKPNKKPQVSDSESSESSEAVESSDDDSSDSESNKQKANQTKNSKNVKDTGKNGMNKTK